MERILRFDKTKPYAFISYKSDDNAIVKKDVKILQDKYGVNIWFDEELDYGSQWDTQVKPIINAANCKMVLFYASPKALASTNVQEEIIAVQVLMENVGLKWLPINFHDKQFREVYRDGIHFNNNLREENESDPDRARYFSVDGALNLVTKYLNDKVNVIRRHKEHNDKYEEYENCAIVDDYYEKIIYEIKKQTPEIVNKDILVTNAKAQTETPQASAKVADEPKNSVPVKAKKPTKITTTPPTPTPRKKYRLTTQNQTVLSHSLDKGSLVLAVIGDYIKNNAQVTLDELVNSFPCHNSNNCDAIVKEESSAGNKEASNVYQVDKCLKLADGTKVAVAKGWAVNIDKFIEITEALGYKVDGL